MIFHERNCFLSFFSLFQWIFFFIITFQSIERNIVCMRGCYKSKLYSKRKKKWKEKKKVKYNIKDRGYSNHGLHCSSSISNWDKNQCEWIFIVYVHRNIGFFLLFFFFLSFHDNVDEIQKYIRRLLCAKILGTLPISQGNRRVEF